MGIGDQQQPHRFYAYPRAEERIMRTFESVADLAAATGETIGQSDWVTITQEDVNLFAEATGDDQWIHVDPERAAAGPFGAPIAHGYLTLSLTNYFLPQIVEVRGGWMGITYGVDKVRFRAPVRVGSRIRAGAEITAVAEIPGG